ncbi:hypothetical protein PSHT_00009 [Puccinia striiformis]|uniref:Uncharacterized protein n=3 Tax=Puccinia striiformis TaxID=27350 RepID=A0A0L0VXJ2_9BASI|nr:hypothetical protein PSTG_03014 [Puccinia striiformis f. sp. tritici PST-78]POW14735.1 hypothetical protein PSTT_02740 [Puccinia striiformis]POW23560.1 hypothetical protein PSHT_00009 [Puccinia striiformis]
MTGEDNAWATHKNLHSLTALVGSIISTAQTDREFASLEHQDINVHLYRCGTPTVSDCRQLGGGDECAEAALLGDGPEMSEGINEDSGVGGDL